jgi:pimeloyl-ACP methyl ester carboxylesterase
MSYKQKKVPESLTVPIRSLDHRLYRWGDPEGEPVFLIHGWADTGMSFQFLADEMADDWCLIAPDLRGFGDSGWNEQGYWFPDYLADLDMLINMYAKDGSKVRLIGHSMGGNITTVYAGVFPERVSHVVSLDQYGLADSDPADAPSRYAKWLKQWRDPPRHGKYETIDTMVERLMALAPAMDKDKAQFLAPYWAKITEEGLFESKIDPAHKRINPILYRREEARACWKQVTALTLLVMGEESQFLKRFSISGMGKDFRECFKDIDEKTLPGCGHMLHMERPEELALLFEGFLRR